MFLSYSEHLRVQLLQAGYTEFRKVAGEPTDAPPLAVMQEAKAKAPADERRRAMLTRLGMSNGLLRARAGHPTHAPG